MNEEDIQAELVKTAGELARLNIEGDPTDPETGYQICALQCRRYALLVATAAMSTRSDAWMEEDKYQRTLAEWEKRRASAETNRKNRLLPQIIKRLEEVQGTSNAIAERENNPIFWEDDE